MSPPQGGAGSEADEDVCRCVLPDFNPDDSDITNCGTCGGVLQ